MGRTAGEAEPSESVPRSFDDVVLLSDLHLRKRGANRRLFLRFLHERLGERQLVIVGDLFDWWYGQPGVVPAHFKEVLDALVERGVLWIEGNHDRYVGRSVAGAVEVIRGPVQLRWPAGLATVRHGHLLPGKSRAGLALEALLDSRALALGCRALTGPGAQAVGEAVTWLKVQASGGLGYDGRDPLWLARARRWGAEQPGELAVVGHGHWLGWWPEVVALGDWVHWASYLELDAEGARLRRYVPGLAPDPVLASGPVGALPRLNDPVTAAD